MSSRDALRKAYASCDPEEPAPAGLRVERPKSPVGLIHDRLRSGLAPAKFALVGGIGTGKSTELLDAQNIVVLPNESEWYFPHPLLTLNVVPKPG